MKKLMTVLVALLFITLMNATSWAQLSGTKTIPGDYATIEAAIAALNAAGVGAGGVTFNVAAGHTETFTTLTAGLITATGTADDPIIFQKSGSGANPLITAATPGVGNFDYIIAIKGGDYITFDAIDVQENPANTTNAQLMEWGYALVKVDGTNGAQYNTIKNCSITLNKSQTLTRGILSGNHTEASTTGLTVTEFNGTNSYNKIYGNTITNAFAGIYFSGYNHTTAPYNFYDHYNEIGAVGNGNNISNFGGSSTHWGVYVTYNDSVKVMYNNITNTGALSTSRGVYISSGTNVAVWVNYNYFSMTSSATTNQLTAIENGTNAAILDMSYNTIQSFSYTTATTGTMYLIYNNGATGVVTINNNTINDVTLAGTSISYAINVGSPTGVGSSCNNNVIKNINRTGGSGTQRGIVMSSPTNNMTFNNNTIDSISWTNTTSTGSIDGIYGFTSATDITVNGNFISNLYVPTTGTITGIREYGSAGTKNIKNNEIHDFGTTAGGAGGATMYGIYVSTGTVDISGNTIYKLNSTGTTGGSSGTISGLNIGGVTLSNVYKNNIYNLSTNSTNPVVYGVYLSGGTTHNVYNNFISDLKAPFANAGIPIAGIYASSGTTDNIFYNTIYLNAASTGATFGTAGIYANTTPTVDMRNNIVVNNSTANGTGLTVAYRRSGTTLTSYSNNSNNNAFYAGVPSATNLIFYDGTNSDQTLAAFKARVTPRDANSVTENPPFVNVVTTPYDLHINPAVATQLESGGVAVSTPIAITDDFDGNARNATTPDIGADEGGFTMMDLNGPAISYTALSNTASTANRTLSNVTITDPSGIAGDPNRPRLYFKKNTDASWVSVQANETTSPYSFTTDYTLVGGGSVTAGDIIQYFVIAQDVPGNVAANPGAGLVATDVNTITNYPTTPNQYTILGTISGVKTVGTGGDYATLTAAIADLNAKELVGPLTLSLLDADYSTAETFPLTINANSGSSATNTVTIKPATGVTSTITGGTASSVISLNGCDYVTIDGSNTVGGTTKDLTIVNTYTGGTFNFGVGLYHNGTKGATNNTIKNCVIKGTPTVTNSYGVLLNYSGGNYHNTSIINNTIKNAKVGIQFVGVSGGVTNDGIISGNTIGDATEPIKLGGIVVSYANNTLITGNDIFGEAAGNSNYSQYGISLGTASTNTKIRKNVIHDFYYNGTGGWGNRGIYYNSDATTVTEISNNMIYNIKADGDPSGISYTPAGIMINAGGNLKIYYNSIFMNGATLSASFNSHSAGIAINTGTSLLDIRNNIIKNSMTPVGGTMTHKTYAVYSYVANTAFTNIDYNDYFVDGINPNVGYLGSDRVDLAAWQSATGQDVNSISGNPGFVSATDLHIDVYNASPVGNAGTPLVGVVDDDIDGDLRSATTPDIGADEYTGVSPAAFALLSPANAATSVPINGNLLWEKSLYATSYEVYLETVNPPTTLVATVTDTFYTYSLSATTQYYWKVKAINGNGSYETGVFSFTTGTNPPAAPTALTFYRVRSDSVYMQWTDNATDEDGFRVYRSTDLNGAFTNISGDLASLAGTGLTGEFVDAGLSPSVKYYYKVVAFSTTQGESAPALDSISTYPVIPGVPTFANIAYTTVNVIIDQNGNSAVTEYAIAVAGLGFVQADGSIGASEVWRTYAQWGGATGKMVTGLTPNTAYTFNVKARNLDGIETGYSSDGVVTTLAPLALPFVEDFTSTTYPPTGWSRQGTVIGSRQTAVQPNGTSGGALRFYFYSVSTGSDTLITPLIDMTSTGTIVFRFSHAYRQYTTENDRFRVLLSTDDGATWDTTLFDKQGAALATLPPSTSSFTPAASSDWRNNLIIIPEGRYSATTRLMLIATSAYGNNLWIDDIKLESLKNIDYALTGISMVNGIPSPFMLKTDIPTSKYAEFETVTGKDGVARTHVNNSRILSAGKAYQGKVKAVANNNDLTELNIEATRPITMRFNVSNLGMDTTATFDLAWDVAGVSQSGYSSTTGISFNSSVNVDIGGSYTELGTYTTNASIAVTGDADLTNNSLSFYRTLIYPDSTVRIRYDNGTNVQSTFIGVNGPPFLAGVRYTAPADMHLTQIDALYRNESSTDSITVQIWAAGATNGAPGALLFEKNFGGENYISAAGDYITLPLGDEAPVFASGTDFWVSIGFANVPYPMGAHNSGFTPGRSFYSMDAGATWSPLVITTERAWLMRVVGVPYVYSAPTAVNLLQPADQTFITVDETSTDDATILWTSSTDANGDPVTYSFWASLHSDFSDSLGGSTGSDTTLTLAYSAIDAALAAWGVADGDTADIYWKVIATDGMFETPSVETFVLTAYRYIFVPTKGWTLQNSGTTEDLYSVKAVSQTVAWAAGAAGTVLRTVNGGTTWVNVGGGALGTDDIYNITALDENTAFVTNTPSSSKIFRTTDGGANWTEVYDQVGGFIDAIHMFDATNGIAYGDPVGGKWTILNTTDGGATWYRIATEPVQVGTEAGWNNAMVVVGTTHIWFGTNNNRVYYTTDGGLTWGFGSMTFANSSDLHFLNETIGVVGGGTSAARSVNGGLNWTNVTPIPGSGNIYGVDGAGMYDFWLSRGSTINRSTDQGATWANEFTVTGTVYGMSFVDYTPYTSGWVVTSGGNIAAFYDSTTVVGIKDVTEIPKSFSLYQNYPNPFNPTTTIKYDLKENAKVTLKIYNSLGQEVRTLVNATQNAGTYSLNWDGKNNAGVQVSSGVYIYRIQAGNFVKSHKMMLLK